jgi:hypothetical protein
MANARKRVPENVAGDFFVDRTCINCWRPFMTDSTRPIITKISTKAWTAVRSSLAPDVFVLPLNY